MGLFSKKRKKQVIGYRYYMGMHMVAGHANIDEIEKIRVGEKVVWQHSDLLRDSYTSGENSQFGSIYDQEWVAQTFIATSNHTIGSVNLKLIRVGASDDIVNISIRATSGLLPTGADLCSGTIASSSITDVAGGDWYEIFLGNGTPLISGTKYAIVMSVPNGTDIKSVDWRIEYSPGNYSSGNLCTSGDSGSTWQVHPFGSPDCMFETYERGGTPPNHTIYINKPNIFGGDKKEGGVQGDVDILFGYPSQIQNHYLVSQLDSDIPAFRGLFSAILNQVYVGTSPYIKPWSFFCKRVATQINGDAQWYLSKAVIRQGEEDGDDLNVAHIIREALIAPEWGLGWTEADIDDDSFKEAANILHEEEFGLSMFWDQVTPIEDFIDETLNYIAGILYQDLSTGKWVLSLTRDIGVDTAYDSNSTDDTTQANMFLSDNKQWGQTFTTSRNYSPASVKIKIYKDVASTMNARVELQSVDVNGHPNGNVLAYGNILTGDIPESSAAWVECVFTVKSSDLTVNTQYALVVYATVGTGRLWWRNGVTDFTGGELLTSFDGGSTWSASSSADFMFEIFTGGELETFSESDIMAVEDFSRPAYGEIIDVVTVKYWDKLNNKSRSTEDRDNALIEKQGALIEKILNYQGICNSTLANQVAARELKLMTSMLAGVRLKCTRKMAHLKPNSIFKFSWGDLDIVQMSLRVLNANYGNLHRNEVILTCVEDAFQNAPTVYGDAADTLQEAVISDPVDVTNRRILEIPYFTLISDILGSKDLVDALDDDTTYPCVVAGKPVDDSFDFDLLVRQSALLSFEDVGQGNNSWTPTGTLTDGLAQDSVDIDIDLSIETDLDIVKVDTYAIINEEIILINSIDTDNKQINISRGILDTTPQAHSAGDIIYFMGLYYTGIADDYTVGDTPAVKILTRTSSGTLDEADASIETTSAFDSRMIRPYAPGNLKFNGFSYPSFFSSAAYGNKVALTWNHRDRTHTTQLDTFVLHTEATNYGPEVGTTYTIKIYNQDAQLGRTVTGLSGTSYDYTEAFEVSDFGSLQEELRFVIYAVRGGYNSWLDGHDVTIKRSFLGTINATSSLSGKLIPSMDSAVSATSSLSGSLSVVYNLAGSTDSTSSTSGDINLQKQLDGSSVGSSGVTGSVWVEPDLSDLTESYTSGMDNFGGSAYWSGPTDRWLAQTFQASENYDIAKTILEMYRSGNTPGNVTLSIRAVDGSDKPTGADLCSAIIDGSDITTDSGGELIRWDYGSPASLTNGTTYAIVLKSPVNSDANIRWHLDESAGGYGNGNMLYSSDGGSTWTHSTGADYYFKNYK